MENKLTFTKVVGDYSLEIVRGVINTYGGLISDKSFYQMKEATYFILVDKETDIPVGITGYRELNSWCVEQLNTVILPESRGKGYGNEASCRLSRWLLGKRGYGKVFCTINVKNYKMIKIKVQNGFTIEGVLKNHFSSERSIFILSKFGCENNERLRRINND